MLDDVNKPLGMGWDRAPRTDGGPAAMLFATATVIVAVVLAEIVLIPGRPLLQSLPPAKLAVIETPAATKPPPAPGAKNADQPDPLSPRGGDPAARPPLAAANPIEKVSAAKPPHTVAGAPEPLIIDVQQALAAVRDQPGVDK
jgi:hypothetical protein